MKKVWPQAYSDVAVRDGVPNDCDMMPGCNDNAAINGDGKTNLADLILLTIDWLCAAGF